jgi:protein ImuA
VELRKNAILSQLERQILPLQGLKKLRTDNDADIDCKAIEHAFPNNAFPIGCTHEFITRCFEDAAPTNGFIACILGKLMRLGGVCIWISTNRQLYPPSLIKFNVVPEHIIFIDLKHEKDVLYITEEALKCDKITAVIAEIKNLSLKESRRFQLAAEQSRVTGFVIRHQPKIINTIASVSRWRISSLPSELEEGMPGVGFPRWKVELLKIRNGTPSNWTIEWANNNFNVIKEHTAEAISNEALRKVS